MIFKWSLKESLMQITDPVDRARISVFYFVFLLNYPKVVVGFIDHLQSGNTNLLRSDLITFIFTTGMLQLLLQRPAMLRPLIHFYLCIISIYVYKALFFYQVDIPIMQQIFMAVTFSFYGLGRRWGIFYTTLMVAGIVISNLLGFQQQSFIAVSSRYENIWFALIIILSNFVAIVISHFYFHSALFNSLTEIKGLNKILADRAKAKGDFLSTMSHELRTPLNAVIGMANILADGNKDKEQQENLGILKFSAETLLSLINNVLDFSKMDSDKIVLEAVPFHLGNLMSNACAGFEKMSQNKGLDFHLEIDRSLTQHQVVGDPTRLIQIIFNLVGNAIKFTHKGNVRVSVEQLLQTKEDTLVRFSIADTGVGIKPEQMKLIFEPFLQASENITRNFGGTGLGLSIVKYLLKMQGSAVMVESTEGVGTRFYFDIRYPLVQAKLTPTQAFAETELPLPLQVLLAEDNTMNILLMKKLFSNWGVGLTIAENGVEAITAIENQDYDLVLMDLNMPVMDGYQAIHAIRAMEEPLKAGVYIIALTASSADEVSGKLGPGQVNDFLSKPFDPNELREKMIKSVGHAEHSALIEE